MDLIAATRPDPTPVTLGPRNAARGVGRINLKAVGEVLAARGLDPTEAIIDILQPMDPATGLALPCRL